MTRPPEAATSNAPIEHPRNGIGTFLRACSILRRPWFFYTVVAVLILVHVGLVYRHFPLRCALRGQPLCSGDLSFHYAGGFEAREVLRGGRLWGYSNYFMSGYPFGLWNSVGGRRAFEFIALLTPGAPLPIAFGVYLLCAVLLPPFIVAAAALVLGLGRRRTALCLAVAIVIYQCGNMTAYFWSFGNVAFPLVNSLAVLYAAFLAVTMEKKQWWNALIAGVLAGLIAYLHQLVLLPVLICSLCLLWLHRKELTQLRMWICGLLVIIPPLIMVAPWLFPLLEFSHTRAVCRITTLTGGVKSLIMDLLSDRAYRHHFDRRALFHLQLVLVVVAVVRSVRERQRAVLGLALSACAVLLCAYAFEYSSFLKQTQPYRYMIAFAVMGIIPASLGLERLADWWQESNGSAKIMATALGLVLLPALLSYAPDVLGRSPATPPNDSVLRVMEWINAHEQRGGRILCEDELVGNLIPVYTKREVVGGAVSRQGTLIHCVCSAGAGEAFARPIDDIDHTQFAEYLDLYNIGCVVAFTRGMTNYMAAQHGWTLRHQVGRYRIYADARPLGYVLTPNASADTEVYAAPNSIRVEQAPEGQFTLKYHYCETLRAPDGVELIPVSHPLAAAPLLGVVNHAGHTTINIVN